MLGALKGKGSLWTTRISARRFRSRNGRRTKRVRPMRRRAPTSQRLLSTCPLRSPRRPLCRMDPHRRSPRNQFLSRRLPRPKSLLRSRARRTLCRPRPLRRRNLVRRNPHRCRSLPSRASPQRLRSQHRNLRLARSLLNRSPRMAPRLSRSSPVLASRPMCRSSPWGRA